MAKGKWDEFVGILITWLIIGVAASIALFIFSFGTSSSGIPALSVIVGFGGWVLMVVIGLIFLLKIVNWARKYRIL